MQLVHNGLQQLLRVIGQIAADVFQHRWGEHTDGAVLAVDPSRVLGFHPVPGAPGELKPRIGACGFQPLLQLVGRLHRNHGGWIDRHLGSQQLLAHAIRLRSHRHKNRLGAKRLRLPSATGVDVLRADQIVEQHFPEPHQALGPDQRQVGVGHPLLAAWIEPFLIDGTGRDLIELGVETFAVLFNGQGLELAV